MCKQLRHAINPPGLYLLEVCLAVPGDPVISCGGEVGFPLLYKTRGAGSCIGTDLQRHLLADVLIVTTQQEVFQGEKITCFQNKNKQKQQPK